MLLNVHPGISTIGELKATSMGPISEYQCSCGAQFEQCQFWGEVKEAMHSKGSPLDFDDFGTHFKSKNYLFNKILRAQIKNRLFEMIRRWVIFAIPSLKQEYRDILEINKSLIEIISNKQQGSIFVDGSKDAIRLLYMHESDEWEIYVIKLVRDGRAQANSARNKVEENIDYKVAVREWKSTILQMDEVCSYIPASRVLSVKYEDLCENPNDIMNKVFNFVGIEKIDQDWSDVVIDSGNQHIIGNNMRKKQSIKIKLDTKWKQKVSDKEMRFFDKIARKVNKKLGYQSDVRS
jgi:hypothetical protein